LGAGLGGKAMSSPDGVARSEKGHVLAFRLAAGEFLPGALVAKLHEEGVASGWLRASGVLVDVELRTLDGRRGVLGAPRVLSGPVQALTIDGAIGMAGGSVGCSLRAVLAREGDAGLELLGGEIQAARAIGLEVMVVALDDVALERGFDAAAGVWLLGAGGSGPSAVSPGEPPHARTGSSWLGAVAASDDAEARGAPGASSAQGTRMPQKPARQAVDFDSPAPETGDVVEHFAFGRCEVVKGEGDRLHLRVPKDARIKEIALEMLRVTPLEDLPAEGDGAPRRRFKLDRKM
jgi:predicted DNA-binding protein with PD1-like motif